MNQRTTINTIYSVFFSSVLALLPLQLFADQHAGGDTLTIPVASQAADMQHVSRPHSGQKGQRVIEQFGEPLAVSAPVGDPPITRWDYADYHVYFEYDHVIRTVLKHREP